MDLENKTLEELVMEYAIIIPERNPIGFPPETSREDQQRARDLWKEIVERLGDKGAIGIIKFVDAARDTLKLAGVEP